MITKQNRRCNPIDTVAMVFCAALFASTATTQAQDSLTKETAALVVDGSVQNVFQTGFQHLVQILVQSSRVPRSGSITDANYPAPGQYVYVHVTGYRSSTGRPPRSSRLDELPMSQSRIRAFLAIGRSGQWESISGDWYTDNPGAEFDSTIETGQPGRGGPQLGVTTQLVSTGRETALKVVSVAADSPAAKAGIEPGDILIQVNRVPLRSREQLSEAYRTSRGNFSLTVRDLNTGRDVRVKVSLDSNLPSRGSTVRPSKSLGAKVELAFFGGEPVLKVTAVQPNSPAQKAGLAPGLLILKANGKTIASPKDLDQAERDSRGTMELQVVDPINRRQRTIRVTL